MSVRFSIAASVKLVLMTACCPPFTLWRMMPHGCKGQIDGVPRGRERVYQWAEAWSSCPGPGALAGVRLGLGLALPACPADLQAITVAVQLEDVHMVSEPIKQGSGEPLGAEHAGPLVERQIASHNHRAALVALTEHLE